MNASPARLAEMHGARASKGIAIDGMRIGEKVVMGVSKNDRYK